MKTVDDIIELIEDNDIKFIKMSFCDIFGRLKNVSLNASHFAEACANGVTIDSSALGLPIGEDMLLVPDIDTVTSMPWRPSTGAVIGVMCHIRQSDGKPSAFDGMKVLKIAEEEFEKTGYTASIMTESEFYITKLSENGEPTLIPADSAGYLDAAPLDGCENLRREIVLTLESMDMKPLSSHHESGHGQNAVIFAANTAYKSAVNTIEFRNAVKNIAHQNGRYATFAPSPIVDSVGSNFRVVIELRKNGSPASREDAEKFAEGVLARLPEIAVFTNPVRNSYLRLIYKSTPNRLKLGGEKAAIRIIDKNKIEIVSADTACNPFIVLTLILKAGGAALRGECAKLKDGAILPPSLAEAVDAAKQSDFVKESLPEEFLQRYLDKKASDANDFSPDDIIRDGL